MIGKTVSHYKIVEELGRGGMGVVYRAEDTKLDRFAALKFLAPQVLGSGDEKARFIHEAKTAASLSHPNICTIFEIDEAEGQSFIAMEYVEGKSLKSIIKSGPLKLDEMRKIAMQIAEGLNEAHRKGIVHRDIKPDNIMITESGLVKIMDFGLAKSTVRMQLTIEGTTLGTVSYMSPEQERGEEIDCRSDIWSLGVIIYEMVTGQLPFKGDYEQAVIYSILNEDPTPMTALRTGAPVELERITKKAMAKNPGERYQHSDDLLVDLQSFEKQAKSPGRVTGSTADKTGRKAWGFAIAAVAVITAAVILAWPRLFPEQAKEIDSIAVLPLANLSGDPSQDYFADGMTEAIITELSRIKALKVISRTSAMRYKDTDKSLKEIARELNVAAVVEGSAMLVGGKVRITAQLIEAATDMHIWADDYERQFADVIALQKEVASAIAREIKVVVTPKERAGLSGARPVDPDVQNMYLKARFLINQFVNNWEAGTQYRAIDYLEQAIAKDPGFALAYTAIAEAYNNLFVLGGLDNNEELLKSRDWAEKALAIDGTLAEAYTMLADVRFLIDWDWKGAEEYFLRAIEHKPGYTTAHIYYANFLSSMGRHEEAIAEVRRSRELDPMDARMGLAESHILFSAGERDLAEQVITETIEVGLDAPQLHIMKGILYIKNARIEEGLREIQTAVELSGDSLAHFNFAPAYAMSGRTGEARALLEDMLKLPEKNSDAVRLIITTAIYLGEKDLAFEWLEEAYQKRDFIVIGLKESWRFEPIRSDPRFAELLRKMNLHD